MDKEIEQKMKEKHYAEYEALAQELGIDTLRRMIPKDWRETIKLALATGDDALNTISLKKWDRIAGIVNHGYGDNFHLIHDFPWNGIASLGLSAAERVCLLKHVAQYHLEPTEEELEKRTLEHFIHKEGIRMTSERVAQNPHMEDGFQGNHYKCTLRRKNKRMTIYFSKGPWHEGKEPKVDEVLDCLASDAIDRSQTFESWASDLGLNPDSRKAEKLYKICLKQDRRVRSFLGDAYQRLLEAERL